MPPGNRIGKPKYIYFKDVINNTSFRISKRRENQRIDVGDLISTSVNSVPFQSEYIFGVLY